MKANTTSVTCLSVTFENPFFTAGKSYQIIDGAFGNLILNDKGEKTFLASSKKIHIAPWTMKNNWAIFA